MEQGGMLACKLDIRSLPEAALDAIAETLPPARREKLERIRPLPEKKRSAGAGLALGWALARLGLDGDAVAYAENGKPYLRGMPEASVSVTHSGDWAACVLAEAPASVDIEARDGVRESVLRRAYTERERAFCEAASSPEERERRFYDLWCRKECMAKMRSYRYAREIETFSPEHGSRFYDSQLPGHSCVLYTAARPGPLYSLRWSGGGLLLTGMSVWETPGRESEK